MKVSIERLNLETNQYDIIQQTIEDLSEAEIKEIILNAPTDSKLQSELPIRVITKDLIFQISKQNQYLIRNNRKDTGWRTTSRNEVETKSFKALQKLCESPFSDQLIFRALIGIALYFLAVFIVNFIFLFIYVLQINETALRSLLGGLLCLTSLGIFLWSRVLYRAKRRGLLVHKIELEYKPPLEDSFHEFDLGESVIITVVLYNLLFFLIVRTYFPLPFELAQFHQNWIPYLILFESIYLLGNILGILHTIINIYRQKAKRARLLSEIMSSMYLSKENKSFYLQLYHYLKQKPLYIFGIIPKLIALLTFITTILPFLVS
ncbi:MAG: hypothetical protein ACXACR_16440 [Candidatus Hodarchaeales archaeon]|jgi:hypothetical protein